jgi:aspartyl-tRNA(Asn)/glutamyl-tRNA(Gln) amidotransferase subunit B
VSHEKFEMVVGLEVHVQLKTRTKAFCGCSTDFGAAPNVNTCPVCLALPGALPVLNERAVELAAKAALGLGCTLNPTSVFARKNYFYPDLPKGYQISQFDYPLATGGWVTIGEFADKSPIRIGITRLHMEEDAGKSIHDRYTGATAIDLNRAGVPLVEIVSEPDIRTSEGAGAYLRTLRQILLYLGVSDVSMEEGSLRVDANVSARPFGETKLGTKTEVKNMNSFSAVEKALEFEFERQCGMLSRGEKIQQQTLLWDSGKGEARPSRTKEGSHDYRYFPEPDLRPLILSAEWMKRMKDDLPELPDARRKRFAEEYKLSTYDVDTLTVHPDVANYFEVTARESNDAKAAANWVLGEVLAALNASNAPIDALRIRPTDLSQLITLIKSGSVSHSAGKRIFAAMLASGQPPAQIAADEGLLQVGEDDALAGWIDEVFAENPAEAARFAGGEKKLQGVLVGLVMKKSKGRADPKRVNQLLASRSGS